MIKGTISYKPLKSGKIAVLMEVEAAKDHLLALTEMYGEDGFLLSQTEIETMRQSQQTMPADMAGIIEKLLTMARSLRADAEDIEDMLGPLSYKEPQIPVPIPTLEERELAQLTLDAIKETRESLLVETDEFPATHDEKVDMMAPENAKEKESNGDC